MDNLIQFTATVFQTSKFGTKRTKQVMCHYPITLDAFLKHTRVEKFTRKVCSFSGRENPVCHKIIADDANTAALRDETDKSPLNQHDEVSPEEHGHSIQCISYGRIHEIKTFRK